MAGHKDYPGAGRFVPGGRAGLATVARAATACRGCDLHERATQTVFGQGAATAEVVLIGEQPGDAEDRVSAHDLCGAPGQLTATQTAATMPPVCHALLAIRQALRTFRPDRD